MGNMSAMPEKSDLAAIFCINIKKNVVQLAVKLEILINSVESDL
jgi:hypothetical protein